MSLRSNLALFGSLFTLSMLPGLARADVLQVAGSGASFSQIIDAVDAAVDGDTIQVAAGTYERFFVDDKSLQIIAEPGTVTVTGIVRLRNMSRSKTVRISGFRFTGIDGEAVLIYDNQGQVFLQDCTAEGTEANVFACQIAQTGMGIVNSSQVILVDCIVRGGNGANAEDHKPSDPHPCKVMEAAPALAVGSSNLTIHGGEYTGGRAGSAYESDFDGARGGHGGDGIAVGAGVILWVEGVSVAGGNGGDGRDEGTFDFCGNGGDAGDAMDLQVASGGSTVVDLDNVLDPGTPGDAGFPRGGSYYGCEDGRSGMQIRLAPGNFSSPLPGPARRLAQLPYYASDVDTLILSVEGAPGDRVGLMLSERSAYSLRPAGVRLLGTARLSSARYVGTIPTSGSLSLRRSRAGLTHAGALGLGLQAMVVDPLGARHLTNVRWIDPLDSLTNGQFLYRHWTLDDLSGNSVTERVNGEAAQYVGNVVLGEPGATPALGTSVHFGGVGNNQGRAVSTEFDIPVPQNTMTVTFWMRRDGGQSLNAQLVGPVNGDLGAGVTLNADHELAIEYYGSTAVANYDSDLFVPDDEWVFVAFTIAPRRFELYLGQQGVLTSWARYNFNSLRTYASALRIGGGASFNGWIDDVRVYHGTLGSAKLQYLYEQAQ